MITINITLVSNLAVENATSYAFFIEVSRDSEPLDANLHCFTLSGDFIDFTSTDASTMGECTVSVSIPNSEAGPAIFIVFAQADFDERLTAFSVYPFAHMSIDPQPNQTFLNLSPLNYTLNIHSLSSEIELENVYSFSFSHNANLSMVSSSSCSIPESLDRGPIVLVAQGNLNGTQFLEWTSYPIVPWEFGANLSNSEENVFIYPVTIDRTLYELTVCFGAVE
jgi:hypothetical protein